MSESQAESQISRLNRLSQGGRDNINTTDLDAKILKGFYSAMNWDNLQRSPGHWGILRQTLREAIDVFADSKTALQETMHDSWAVLKPLPKSKVKFSTTQTVLRSTSEAKQTSKTRFEKSSFHGDMLVEVING